MPNIVDKKLSIDKNNIKQYCEAQNVSFDVSDHAWRKWLNGSTDGYVILKSEGKDVLYPTDTAHPFKADSLISASRSAGTCTVDLQFAGTSVHSESYTSGSQTEKSKSDITDSVVTNSTKATEIKWHVHGKNGDNQRGDKIELTLYFYQYTMSANIGTDVSGIKTVTVSSESPYFGDSVTFSADLIKGVTWDGWYSDAACTKLVSTNQNYTIAVNSDVTLYAKAIVSSTIYTCAAVAKDNISSVTVSDESVTAGESCTFSATASEHYEFDGWYLDSNCITLVSNQNPYTTTINDNTTLYAKAKAIMYPVNVASTKFGTATVTPASAPYGETVTFTYESNQVNRGIQGWYADSEYKTLLSMDATYSCKVTGVMTLYPKEGHELHTIILHPTGLFDVRPYRGFRNANASDSIPVDAQNLINNTVGSTTYAYQPHKNNTTHTYGLAFHVNPIVNGVDKLANVPDNATIYDMHADFSYSFADTGYSSAELYSGVFNYISESDETPAVKRGTSIDVSRSNAKMLLTLDYSHIGNWSILELKSGKLGFQINSSSNGNTSDGGKSEGRMLKIFAVDIYVIYTVEDESYHCDVVSDGHIDVSISSHDNIPGTECAWTALPEGGYRFDGWYSDPDFENLVSNELTYKTNVTESVTLYAKSKYHSRVVTRTLEIPFGNGKTYFEGQDNNGTVLDPSVSGSGWKPDFNMADYGWFADVVGISGVTATAAMCNGGDYVSAVINSDGMNILYPNATAHPTRLDSHALLGRASISTNLILSKLQNPINEDDWIQPTIDGVGGSVWRPNMINNVAINNNNIRLTSILNTTRSSRIEYAMHQYTTSKYRAVGINDIKLTMYFEEYDFKANIASETKGITSVTTSQSIGYEGDTVTFSAVIAGDARFDGWYSDDNCTNLVSKQQEYSVTPNANLTLYAKATVTNALYFKANGSYKPATKVYKKVSGAWVEQEDLSAIFSDESSGSASNYAYGGSV